MSKHAAETFVAIDHAAKVTEKICSQIHYFCRSIATEGSSKFLIFEDGCAILSPTNDGLIFRVFAQDLIVFHGIQTIIEGMLFRFTAISDHVVEWIQADDPFQLDR